jgi:hypothetical protein
MPFVSNSATFHNKFLNCEQQNGGKPSTHDLTECRTLWFLWHDSKIRYWRAVSHEDTMNSWWHITASQPASHVVYTPQITSAFILRNHFVSFVSRCYEHTILFFPSCSYVLTSVLFILISSSSSFCLYLKRFLFYHISPPPSFVNITLFFCWILPGYIVMLLSSITNFFLTFNLYSSTTTLFIHIYFTSILLASRFQCLYCAV